MTSSSGKGICWRASYSTILAIWEDSTGGSWMKRARALWPGTLMPTRQPLTLLRSRNVSSACGISWAGLASGWGEDLGVGDQVEGLRRPAGRCPGSGRSLIALRAACPISMPHTG